MKSIQRIIAIIFSAVWAILPLAAVEPTWSFDFGSVFDNREGDNKYAEAKTFFFTNLAVEGGIKFTKHDRISAGAVWNQPVANDIDDATVRPIVYYRHSERLWGLSLGMFPRTQLREQLPGFLWSDSLTYFQHNIRGALVQYHSDKAFIDFYLDWRQRQTETKREQFNIVFHGEWRPRASTFLVGGHLMMNHYALTKNAPDDMHIVDNFMVNPYVGLDFSRHTSLDSLVVKAGALATVERNRANGSGWKTPVGGWVELLGEWKWLGLKNSFYAGGRLMPSYGEFGASLYQGEPYYQSKFYNRTDVYAHIVLNKWVDLQASLDFNIAQSSFIFYQRLSVRVLLNWTNLKFKK